MATEKKDFGIFNELVPNKGAASPAPEAAPKKDLGIFSSLVPEKQTPAPAPASTGIGQKLKGLFTKETPQAPQSEVKTAGDYGMFSELVPGTKPQPAAPTATPAPQSSKLDEMLRNLSGEVASYLETPPDKINPQTGRYNRDSIASPEYFSNSVDVFDEKGRFVETFKGNDAYEKAKQKSTEIGGKVAATPSMLGGTVKTGFLGRAANKVKETIGNAIEDFAQKGSDLFYSLDSDNKGGALDRVTKGTRAGVSAANLIFSPVSSLIAASEQVPVLKYPAIGVSYIFGKVGEAGGWVSDKVVDSLPVSDATKEAIRPAAAELSSLLFQTAAGYGLGKAGKVAKEKTAALRSEINTAITKDVIETNSLDAKIYIEPAKVRDIFQTGKKISPVESQLIKDLGLTGEQYKDAIRNGITIDVPAERVLTIVDKPYWAKVKDIFNIKSEPEVIRTGGGKPAVGPRGFIEQGGAPAAPRDFGMFNDLVAEKSPEMVKTLNGAAQPNGVIGPLDGIVKDTRPLMFGENAPEASKLTAAAPVFTGATANANIGNFKDGTPVLAGGLNEIKPFELPEIVQLAKDLMGQTPRVKDKLGKKLGVFRPKGGGEIELSADIFKDTNQAAKTLAHEIGHLVDYLPDQTQARGNLLGRLLTLRNFGKETFEDNTRLISNKTIRDELSKLSEYWRPYDKINSSPTYLKYRASGKELYADALSALFNSPGLLEKMAPTFYKEFFDALDRKPLARDAYFETQALLSGERIDLIKARRSGVQQMFKDGDYKAIELQKRELADREARKSNFITAVKYALISKNYPLIDRVNKLTKEGKLVNPDENPVYYLEERNYLGGRIKATLERDFASVYKNLMAAEIPWHTFGETLFYDRIIAGDRSKQANPRGITTEAAKELRDDLYNELTPAQKEVLNKSVAEFRDGLKKIATEAYEEGLYSKELYDNLMKNPAYATFQVIEHLEDGMSSKIYKSIGTLKDITNPADASILKAMVTIRAIEYNKVKRQGIEFMNENFKDEIEPAKTVYNGKTQTFVDPEANSGQSLVTYMEDGKPKGYYVDEYVAHTLNNESVGQANMVMRLTMSLLKPISWLNKNLFRPLFIGYNPGFQAFNFLRDFQRFWKNIPDMTLARAISRYRQAYPLAKVRGFGLSKKPSAKELAAAESLHELEKGKVFSTTFNDMAIGKPEDETQIDLILRNSGIDAFAPDPTKVRKFFAPIIKVLETIQKVGNVVETLPKAAGFYEFTDNATVPLTMDQKSYIRKYIGSPDFLDGGWLKPAANDTFLFSNSIAQGWRSDLELAVGNLKSGGKTARKQAARWWWKVSKLGLLPKILMFGAAAGLFGEKMKKIMENVSEYDKTNYAVVPIGLTPEGKSVVVRLPQDESTRLIGAMFWKLLNIINPSDERPIGQELADIFTYAGGQVPNISPAISTPNAIFEYLQGRNPYDSFRGRNVISQSAFEAGGNRARKELAGWVFNQLGGSVFYRYANEGTPKVQSPAEKFINLPVVNNILGRFVRITDYGQEEKLKQVAAAEKARAANEKLDIKDVVVETLKTAVEDKNAGMNRQKYLNEINTALFGKAYPTTKDEIAQAKYARDRFDEGLKLSKNDPLVRQLIYAGSNKEKAAMLKYVQGLSTPEEFKALKQQILQLKLASPAVFDLVDANE